MARICGDGKPYSANLYCMVEDSAGVKVARQYTSRFNTRAGWQTLRLPFAGFIPKIPGDPPLDTATVDSFSFAYEARRVPRTADTTMASEEDSNRARLEVRHMDYSRTWLPLPPWSCGEWRDRGPTGKGGYMHSFVGLTKRRMTMLDDCTS